MPRLSRIAVSVLGAWLCGAGGRSAGAADDFAFYHEDVMGTSLELRVRADDAEAAREAEGACSARSIASPPSSATTTRRASSAAGNPPRRARRGSPRSSSRSSRRATAGGRRAGGAFDPRLGALTRLWSRCAAQGRTPSPEERAGAVALMGRPAWRLDPEARTAERLTDGPLSLDAIAKGFIIERACAVGAGGGRGVRGLLLNVGGDLRVLRRRPDDRHRLAEGGLRDVRAADIRRGPRPGGRHQRPFPARAPHRPAAGTPTSSTPDRACPPTGSPRRRSSRSGPPTRTPWRRPSTCSRPRTACAWWTRCRGSNA
jgi:hypothetical protein